MAPQGAKRTLICRVTSSKALVPSSVALVTSSDALVTTRIGVVGRPDLKEYLRLAGTPDMAVEHLFQRASR